MSNQSLSTLSKIFLEKSESNHLKKALKEWKLDKVVDAESYGVSNCDCAHDIRYEHHIVNTLNEEKMMIGSKCIELLDDSEDLQLLKDIRKSRQIMEWGDKRKLKIPELTGELEGIFFSVLKGYRKRACKKIMKLTDRDIETLKLGPMKTKMLRDFRTYVEMTKGWRFI